MARPTKGVASPKAARRKARKKKSSIAARRKKEFTFQGFTVEQLQAMPLDEILLLLTSRARRSYKRGLNEEEQVFVERLLAGNKPVLKTHRREIIILPNFVGKKVAVYNGKQYMEFEIKPEMIGHYLGEFAPTRGSVRHSGPGVGATRSSKFMPLK
ncbi:MAG: 30S ribosomal protein S19 [Candidatus Thermoplasmatota archaeon]|nr:30S ribosomal protein S19 [Euryarchaeota archaeon]MBU4031942.1 30S ribosomal protein S19 [Candidatus Thermoplasmatota archaeon]MBU4072484.1 30S ribosomal protein S19 [Candidatus Thermoplasmatota archaeon]MBU4144182.1 30S ribosomal protein S19 [Candidatus Thermoplasmatota archaeon]MBU4592816.1 30S ribosomal protein S19 [Candidatus Thermoplasmatota archaeon]